MSSTSDFHRTPPEEADRSSLQVAAAAAGTHRKRLAAAGVLGDRNLLEVAVLDRSQPEEDIRLDAVGRSRAGLRSPAGAGLRSPAGAGLRSLAGAGLRSLAGAGLRSPAAGHHSHPVVVEDTTALDRPAQDTLAAAGPAPASTGTDP